MKEGIGHRFFFCEALKIAYRFLGDKAVEPRDISKDFSKSQYLAKLPPVLWLLVWNSKKVSH